MSRNPVGLAIPPSEYDEEIVVASIKTFITNLEIFDNVILNNLANQNEALYELTKKRAKKKGLKNANSNVQLTTKHSKHSAIGQSQIGNKNQFQSELAQKQSNLSQFKSQNNQLICKNSVHKVLIKQPQQSKMSRRTESKRFDGGYIRSELKANESWGRKESTQTWQGSSVREESLLDPRWHRRPPTKGKKGSTDSAKLSPQGQIQVEFQQHPHGMQGKYYRSTRKQRQSKLRPSENHLYGHKTSGTTIVKPKQIETRKMTQITQIKQTVEYNNSYTNHIKQERRHRRILC